MILDFRLDCPRCRWGQPMSNAYVNKGWLILTCTHCQEEYYARIAVSGVNVESTTDLPEGHSPAKRPGDAY